MLRKKIFLGNATVAVYSASWLAADVKESLELDAKYFGQSRVLSYFKGKLYFDSNMKIKMQNGQYHTS